MKICHITSVHSRFDTRIFIKECSSLARAGYKVSLVVADGQGDEIKNNIHIYDAGRSKTRLRRMIQGGLRVFAIAFGLDADVYHLHDPELIPMGLKLKKNGKKVIFDSHEDILNQILYKSYLVGPLRVLISKLYAVYQNYSFPKYDGIIAATPFIRDKLSKLNPNTIDINNYPILGELYCPTDLIDKERAICYIGTITRPRGIRELIQAMAFVDGKLYLAGKFFEPTFKDELKQLSGWSKVVEYGFVDRAGVADILSKSLVGLVTFYPIPNHIDAQPNKMFEYMSASVAVVGSDFPLWCEILQGNECGLNVNPLDPKAIAQAINYLLDHLEQAQRLGQNGYRAVQEKYNWNIEEEKLLSFYERVIGGNKILNNQ